MDNNNVFSAVPTNGVVCPVCKTTNAPGSSSCSVCGSILAVAKSATAPKVESAPVFDKAPTTEALPVQKAAPAAPAAAPAPAKAPVAKPVVNPVKEPEVEIPQNALAKTLPSWNLEPPQVVVRRKH